LPAIANSGRPSCETHVLGVGVGVAAAAASVVARATKHVATRRTRAIARVELAIVVVIATTAARRARDLCGIDLGSPKRVNGVVRVRFEVFCMRNSQKIETRTLIGR
jgi:hypothetical protein